MSSIRSGPFPTALVRVALIGGSVLMIIGSAVPWYTVGPASRIGLADDGWPVLLAGIVSLGATLGLLRSGRRAFASGAAVASAVALLACIWAVLTPPESMSLSIGVPIATVGAVAVAAGCAVVILAADGGMQPARDDPAPSSWPRVIGRGVGWLGLVAVVLVGLVGCWPIGTGSLDAEPDPTTSFDDALDRFDAVVADEADFVFEPCRSRLLHHGETTDEVVVMFHGLTNCPRQYVEMAESVHEQGANVLVLRAPGHGHATDDGGRIAGAGALHTLDAEDLADYADDAIDIAVGLGDSVVVHGLSMGAVVALWTAQFRDDVSRVVALSPAFALPVVPNTVTNFFTNVFARVPSLTLSHERRIDHDYAAESSRGLAATFALGQAVIDRGLDTGPAVDDVVVVLNPDDPLVSESDVEALVAAWADVEPAYDVVVLDSAGLPHDSIDLAQPKANADAVYPTILDELGYEWSP